MLRVIFQLLLITIIGSLVWAEPAPAIGDILRDPQDYHGHFVTLRGTIRQVKEGPSPLVGKFGPCYGASYFTLEDATGSIPIEYLPVCGHGPDAAPHLSNGDEVTVHAKVIWDHQYPGSVSAIVNGITVLK